MATMWMILTLSTSECFNMGLWNELGGQVEWCGDGERILSCQQGWYKILYHLLLYLCEF